MKTPKWRAGTYRRAVRSAAYGTTDESTPVKSASHSAVPTRCPSATRTTSTGRYATAETVLATAAPCNPGIRRPHSRPTTM